MICRFCGKSCHSFICNCQERRIKADMWDKYKRKQNRLKEKVK